MAEILKIPNKVTPPPTCYCNRCFRRYVETIAVKYGLVRKKYFFFFQESDMSLLSRIEEQITIRLRRETCPFENGEIK